MTEADKQQAVEEVYRDSLISLLCKRDEKRMGRLAEIVFAACDLFRPTSNTESIQLHCLAHLKGQKDYKDTVSFVWWVFLLEVAIKLLIDIWLRNNREQAHG